MRGKVVLTQFLVAERRRGELVLADEDVKALFVRVGVADAQDLLEPAVHIRGVKVTLRNAWLKRDRFKGLLKPPMRERERPLGQTPRQGDEAQGIVWLSDRSADLKE